MQVSSHALACIIPIAHANYCQKKTIEAYVHLRNVPLCCQSLKIVARNELTHYIHGYD